MGIVQHILQFIAGLGALLIGLKIFSETIEKLFSKQLSKLFEKTSKNRFAGVGVGIATSAILHSSSATTVMVVGLANIGVLPLAAASTIIIGANIGTTITAQITALGTIGGSNSLSISIVLMVLTFIGILIDMIIKNDKVKVIGYSLAGFGLIFLGLHIMSSSVSGLLSGSASDVIKNAFSVISNPILLLLIGLLLTAVIQSSTAVTTILISMVAAGLTIGNGGDCVLYIILGTNIGTCATALFSSIGTNINAKRTSLIHLIFNVSGTVIFTLFLVIWNVITKTSIMDLTFGKWFSDAPALQISMFHTFFNVVTAVIFIPLSNKLVYLVKKIVPDKKDNNRRILSFTDVRLLSNPTLALNQVKREIMNLADINMRTLDSILSSFFKREFGKEDKVLKEIEESYEYANEITDYIIKLTSNELNESEAKDASQMHHVIADVLRISEVSDNVVKYCRKFEKENLKFSDGVNDELEVMFSDVKKMFVLTKDAFINRDTSLLNQIDELEEKVDEKRTEVLNGHIERLNAGICDYNNVGVFVNIVANIERIGDHINFIAHSIE